jgi:hypothetical protein
MSYLPRIGIISSDIEKLVEARELKVLEVAITCLEGILECTCLGVVLVASTSAPCGEPALKPEPWDNANLGCVWQTGALVEYHLRERLSTHILGMYFMRAYLVNNVDAIGWEAHWSAGAGGKCGHGLVRMCLLEFCVEGCLHSVFSLEYRAVLANGCLLLSL